MPLRLKFTAKHFCLMDAGAPAGGSKRRGDIQLHKVLCRPNPRTLKMARTDSLVLLRQPASVRQYKEEIQFVFTGIAGGSSERMSLLPIRRMVPLNSLRKREWRRSSALRKIHRAHEACNRAKI